MKIVLIQPPIQDFYDTDIRLQPIGLCYLKAALKKHLPDVDVIVKDYHQGWGRHTVSIPEEMAYLKEFYPTSDKGPFSSFSQYYHFGASFDQITEDVIREKPDLIGISSLFSPYYREVLKLAEFLKKEINIPVLLGGSHVSTMPELMLQNNFVDFVIRGEGEKPFVELIKALRGDCNYSSVPNLGYKENGQIYLNNIEANFPIQEIPNPDLSDLVPERYLYKDRPLNFMITSRSCPHQCDFCAVHLTFGGQYRRRSVDEVLLEIKARYVEGYRVIDFEDDNLTFDIDAMKCLCKRLISDYPAKDMEFVAMNGVSYLNLDSELLSLMKEAGFSNINISLISSNATVRNRVRRPHDLEKYHEVVTEAVRFGIKVTSYQIIGLPGETLNSMVGTLVVGAKLPILLGASPFYLVPNTPIAKPFEPLSEENVFLARLTAMGMDTKEFQREDVYTLFITTRIINFLKSLQFDEKEVDLFNIPNDKLNEDRLQIGIDLLYKLLKNKVLYAKTKTDYVELTKFKSDLFFKVWNSLDYVMTQEGKRVIAR